MPALVLDDGIVLNEGAAVLQYIADQAPGTGSYLSIKFNARLNILFSFYLGTVAPVYGTAGRYLVQQAINYIASEVHAAFGGLFAPDNTEEIKTHYLKKYLFHTSHATLLSYLVLNIFCFRL